MVVWWVRETARLPATPPLCTIVLLLATVTVALAYQLATNHVAWQLGSCQPLSTAGSAKCVGNDPECLQSTLQCVRLHAHLSVSKNLPHPCCSLQF